MLRTRLLFPTLLLASFIPAGVARAQPVLDSALTADLTHSLVVDNLSQPTGAEFLPDGRMIIIQKTGEVLLWNGSGDAVSAGTIPISNDNSERGLIGLAVDPMFATTRRIYFYHSVGNSQSIGWALLDAGTNMMGAPTDILNGLAGAANHDGGGMRFGPDGNLYAGVGDTGCNCGCGPGLADNYFGTCLTVPHGKIVRVDREGGIPPTNPLVGVTGVPQCGSNCNDDPNLSQMAAPHTAIYNWGFRNPWRFDFDEQTGHLWIGDVGEITWEEVTISTGPGKHHGWPYREGVHGDAITTCNTMTPVLNGADCTEPAFEYPHSEAPASGQGSITGGTFSNHCSWPAPYYGRYWFGDYNKARIWSLTPNVARDGTNGSPRVVVVRSVPGVVHFLKGLDGSILYVGINAGQIWRIAPANPVSCDPDAGIPDSGIHPDAAGIPDAEADAGGNDDTGTPPVDSGAPAGDSGTPAVDSGTADDSGTAVGPEPADEEGCGCTTTGVPGLAGVGGAALFTLGLLLVRRRRR